MTTPVTGVNPTHTLVPGCGERDARYILMQINESKGK